MDRLDAKKISAQCGREITVLELTESTNTAAARLAREGAPHGSAVLAERQSAGRGRRGRSFASAGLGLYMTVILRPKGGFAEAGTITPAAAVAVREAISAVCGVEAGIKWVNDLYLSGKKICGILAESVTSGLPEPPAFAVGIGVNFLGGRADLPEDIREKAGFIFGSAPAVSRNDLAARIITNLLEATESGGSAELLEAYRRHCLTVGHEVGFAREGRRLTAFAEEIAPDFGLTVRFPDGRRETLIAGEVTMHGENE